MPENSDPFAGDERQLAESSAGGAADRRYDPVQDAPVEEVVDEMEERVASERRDAGVRGHVEERDAVTPVEPDDQAPS